MFVGGDFAESSPVETVRVYKRVSCVWLRHAGVGCRSSVFGSDVADFFAKKKTGKEASCSRTEKTTSAGTDLSYNQPMMALPPNQAIPKPVSKTPKAVLRFSDGITSTSTAFNNESCAPMPKPTTRPSAVAFAPSEPRKGPVIPLAPS